MGDDYGAVIRTMSRCTGEEAYRAVLAHVGVDFGTDAELGQVDARLDGEADAGDDAAGVVGLEVVQVDALAVDGVVDAVAQAVGEVVAVAAIGDVTPRATSSACQPWMGSPREKESCRKDRAASRAPRTISKTWRCRSVGLSPT